MTSTLAVNGGRPSLSRVASGLPNGLPAPPVTAVTQDATTSQDAVLELADGTAFRGFSFGAEGKSIAGECVFNTSMTGYQEIITDPSYFGQIVTMTAVQIGNYGLTPEDEESAGPKCAGLVIRELSPIVSNWRSTISLHEYLLKNGIPGLSEIDTLPNTSQYVPRHESTRPATAPDTYR